MRILCSLSVSVSLCVLLYLSISVRIFDAYDFILLSVYLRDSCFEAHEIILLTVYLCDLPFNFFYRFCPKYVADILEMSPYRESSTSMRLDSQVHLVPSDESYKNASRGSWPTQTDHAQHT